MADLIDTAPPPSPGGIEVTPEALNRPPNPQTFFLGGLFTIAVLTVCYLAGSIILPIILAVMLKLFLQPIMRFLARLHFPRSVAAFCTIAALLVFFAILGSLISTPLADWTQRLPTAIPKIRAQLNSLSAPINAATRALHKAEVTTLTTPGAQETQTVTVAVKGTTFGDRVLTGTTAFVGGLFKTMLVLFFLLISGDTFLRRMVEIMPRFKDKKQVVEISQQVELDISGYLATITVMNLAVGLVTCIIMASCGIDDPILWGTAAFLLNYVPILGPVVTGGLFALVGIVSLPGDLFALLPAALYFFVRFIEGQFVTPMVLARRFTMNPVLVVLSLVFWYWMWGVTGAILATPLLAIFKIVCDRVERLKPLGHFMAG